MENNLSNLDNLDNPNSLEASGGTAGKRINIEQATRIEGNAKITILLDEQGKVKYAHFNVLELRGFEEFLVGTEVRKVPYIVSRVCGICNVSHQLAAIKAIERAMGIEVSETTRDLRNIMLYGQLIKSHSLNFFFMSLPDMLGRQTNIFEIAELEPELAKHAISLHTCAEKIENVIGKRNIHSIGATVGGLLSPLSKEDLNKLREYAKQAYSLSVKANELAKDIFKKHAELLTSLPEIPANCMSLFQGQRFDFFDDTVMRVANGTDLVKDFKAEEYSDYIGEYDVPWTYSKFPYFKPLGRDGGTIAVGPLARLNLTKSLPCDKAQEELRYFKDTFCRNGGMVYKPMLYDFARTVEMACASEMILQLIDKPGICSENVSESFKEPGGRREGIGAVEAPRGTLIYEVSTEGTKIRKIDIIVPTQHNNACINLNLKKIAEEHISNGNLSEGGRKKLGMFVRAFDPCISCASHTVEVEVEIVGHER